MRILLFFLLLVNVLNAQGTIYGDFQRAVQKNRDDAAYLESLRSRPNNIPWTSGSGVDQKAVEELAERFSRKPSRVNAEDPEARMRAAQEAEEEAEYRREIEEYERVQDIYYRKVDWLTAKWSSKGFFPDEVKYLASKCVSQNEDDKTIHMEVAAGIAVTAMTRYRQIKDSGSYDELMQLIVDMRPAPFTALMAFDQLQNRFPEKKSVIDLIRFSILTQYYGGRINDSWPDTYLFDYGLQQNRNMCRNLFEQLEKQHPEEARLAAGHSSVNPLAEIAKYYEAKKDNKKAAEYYFKVLNTKFSTVGSRWAGRNFNGYRDACMFYFHNPDYVGKISLEQWKQLAKVNNISTLSLLEMISGARPFGLATLSDYNRTEWLYNQTLGLDKMGFPKLFRKLADEGDPEAMNAMAVRFAKGKEGKKNDAIPLFQKAAQAGSLWAHLNLMFACDWGLKDYGPENKIPARQNLKKFLETAPIADVVECGKILTMAYYESAKVRLEDGDFKFGMSLIEATMKLGSEEAKEYAQNHKWFGLKN